MSEAIQHKISWFLLAWWNCVLLGIFLARIFNESHMVHMFAFIGLFIGALIGFCEVETWEYEQLYREDYKI